MMNGLHVVFAAVLVSGAHPTMSNQPAAQRQGYWPPEVLSGTFVGGWELSNFEGCWLDFTEEAERDLVRLLPDSVKGKAKQTRLRLKMLGRRNIQPIDRPPGRHGHIGAYSCAVEATKIFSVEIVSDR